MRGGMILGLLTVCACVHADCLGNNLNRAGSIDADDAPLVAGAQAACPVIINEVLAHAHAEAPDWIELYNAGNTSVNSGGWTLSDRKDDLDKFQIAAGTILKPFGYIVFYENTDFGNAQNPDTRTPFALTENGETLYLSSGKDRVYPDYRAEALLGPSETSYSFGRYGTRYWIEVDRLDYSDGRHPRDFPKKVDPWPTAADGSGPGLERLVPRNYGNDPANWQAAPPTPGSANN